MRSDHHPSQYHTNDMRDTQLTHDNWSKQDDKHHHKEDECRVRYREEMCEMVHKLRVVLFSFLESGFKCHDITQACLFLLIGQNLNVPFVMQSCKKNIIFMINPSKSCTFVEEKSFVYNEEAEEWKGKIPEI